MMETVLNMDIVRVAVTVHLAYSQGPEEEELSHGNMVLFLVYFYFAHIMTKLTHLSTTPGQRSKEGPILMKASKKPFQAEAVSRAPC